MPLKQAYSNRVILQPFLPKLNANQRTYQIKKLLEQGMLQPVEEGARQYTAGFANNYLIRELFTHWLQRALFLTRLLAHKLTFIDMPFMGGRN